MHEEYFGEIQRTTSVEIGWFMSNLTALALEHGLDTSTLLCFPYHLSQYREYGLSAAAANTDDFYKCVFFKCELNGIYN